MGHSESDMPRRRVPSKGLYNSGREARESARPGLAAAAVAHA